MNLKATVATGIGSLAIATAMWFGMHAPTQEEVKGKIPHDKITDMKFPNGVKATGDPIDGSLCHQIVLKSHDGKPDETLFFHRILNKDFRKMTEDEKKAALIEDTQADLEEAGIACGTSEPAIFSEALADSVKRCDGCGGDCWITSCDATSHPSYCTLGGTTCVISFICCGTSGCPATCGA